MASAQAPDDHAGDRGYILKAESDWAEAAATYDASVLERILADDFVGIWIDGSHYSKAELIQWYRSHASPYESNHTNEVMVRFYGHAATAQGSESWKKRDGTHGTWVWTDTWIQRNGKWQIVAAEDLLAPPDYKTQPIQSK